MTTDPSSFKLYRYVPSLAPAIIATVCFGLLTLAHLFRLLKTKSWFCIPWVVGGLFEFVGYIGRILSHSNNKTLGPYIMQSLLILLGPALFAASIYMTLSRVILATKSTSLSLIATRWQTRLFVCGDIVAFLTQMLGGGIQAVGTLSTMKTGENVIIAGLFVQIFCFGFFIATSVVFHYRCLNYPTISTKLPWQRVMRMLYAVSALIMVRSVFRVVEYIMGNDGYLLRREWPLYVFDAALMGLAMGLYLFWYPSVLNQQEGDETFEELGPWDDGRQK